MAPLGSPSVSGMTASTAGTASVEGHTASRRHLLHQLGVDTAYVLTGFPLGIVAFVLAITGLALGAGLLVVVAGLPVLVAALYVARGFAILEQVRIVPVLRRPPTAVRYRVAPREAGRWRRMLNPLTDVQSWLDLLHSILRLPVCIIAFVVVVTWWATAAGGLTYWFWQRFLPRDPDSHDLPELIGLGDSTAVRIGFYTVLGILMAVALPWAVRLSALAEAGLARMLLSGVAELRQQLAGLAERAQTAQAQTAAAVSAEATALRRLERDIHDGPQQRLVRLAMDLGRAQRQLDADPAAARHTVDEALTQAREAIDELRTLSRGIAPPILADRGLAAAVAALAARATIPVELDLPDPVRLPPLVEQTAYFTIAEALTNVAKHSGATQGEVAVRLADGWLTVMVSDDGRGGAHLAKGHGLAGVWDRVQAAGGELSVTSPSGGPTTIRAELPCPTVH